MSSKKIERQINLLAYLLNSYESCSWEEIQFNVKGYDPDASHDSFRRMFERDKDDLRAHGVSIEYDEDGCYLSKEKYYLPEVNFSSEEVVALNLVARIGKTEVTPFSNEFLSAILKLSFDEPIDNLKDTNQNFLYMNLGISDKDKDKFKSIDDATAERKSIAFKYQGAQDNEPAKRDLEPYARIFLKDNWYIVGKCRSKEAVRSFNIKRIVGDIDVNLQNPKKPDFEIPPDFRISEMTDKKPWEWGDSDPIKVTLKCNGEVFKILEKQFSFNTGQREIKESDIVFEIDVVDTDQLLKWILINKCNVEIVSPNWLKEKIDTHLNEIKELYI